VGRREENLAVAVEEVAAGRLAGSCRHAPQVAPVDTYGVLLIARAAVARRLKDQPRPVTVEVRLGVLTAVRQAADVRQVALTHLGSNDRDVRGIMRRAARRGRARERRSRRKQRRDGFHSGGFQVHFREEQ
jgi:hypothetical protein